MTSAARQWRSLLGQHFLALVLTLTTLLLATFFYTHHQMTPTPTCVAKVELLSTELYLAPMESTIPTQASSPDIPLPPPLPTPTEAPILSDAMSEIVLARPPELEQPPLPDVPPVPMLKPVDFKPHKTQLPEIVLPPLQPQTTRAETTQQATGATAHLKQRTKLLTDPALLQKRYPALALKKGWEGDVVLRLTVDANGRLEAVEIETSSGYRVLDNEAKRMIRQAKFSGGPDTLLQKIQFRIPKKEPSQEG